ncbi:MAG: serine/threonine-protein phosphatase [Chlamydiales bacterium]|nr:serine/threonine-protein phosphatase [Chlamydiales bacterium]
MEEKYIISSYACSNIGLVRTSNEDFFSQMHNERFFILADGMGGHNAGEVAAKEAVEFICKEIELLHSSFSLKEHHLLIPHLNQIISSVNERIILLSERDKTLTGMGTTICASYFHQNHLIYTHVGDSRLYRFRAGQLKQITIDHSLENAIKKYSKNFYFIPKNHSKKSLMQAIGIHRKVDPDIGIESVMTGDIYFLCSDGLSDFVSNEEIHEILIKNMEIDKTTESLIEQAIYRGGKDNITVIMMKVHDHLSG